LITLSKFAKVKATMMDCDRANGQNLIGSAVRGIPYCGYRLGFLPLVSFWLYLFLV